MPEIWLKSPKSWRISDITAAQLPRWDSCTQLSGQKSLPVEEYWPVSVGQPTFNSIAGFGRQTSVNPPYLDEYIRVTKQPNAAGEFSRSSGGT